MSICVGDSGLVGAAVFAAPRCARDTVHRQRRGVNDPGMAPHEPPRRRPRGRSRPAVFVCQSRACWRGMMLRIGARSARKCGAHSDVNYAVDLIVVLRCTQKLLVRLNTPAKYRSRSRPRSSEIGMATSSGLAGARCWFLSANDRAFWSQFPSRSEATRRRVPQGRVRSVDDHGRVCRSHRSRAVADVGNHVRSHQEPKRLGTLNDFAHMAKDAEERRTGSVSPKDLIDSLRRGRSAA
jgi:hypothetical protein